MKQININDITETIKKFYDVACTYPFVTNPYIFALEQTLKVVMITSGEYRGDDLKDRLDEALNKLSADAVEVVRCKDCKHNYRRTTWNHGERDNPACKYTNYVRDNNFYCSYGEGAEE